MKDPGILRLCRGRMCASSFVMKCCSNELGMPEKSDMLRLCVTCCTGLSSIVVEVWSVDMLESLDWRPRHDIDGRFPEASLVGYDSGPEPELDDDCIDCRCSLSFVPVSSDELVSARCHAIEVQSP